VSQNNYCFVSGVLFSLVAAAHLLRIVFGLPVQVDAYAVPMLVSWVGFVVPALLAFWAFRARRAPAHTR
jgi:hypothetical protein